MLPPGRAPRYVIFLLGDGMASAQIQTTEAYLTTINGGSARVAEDLLQPENRLNMSKMSNAGMQTTFDSFALMTDSASSATAFASGIKTRSGVIGMDQDRIRSVKSIGELAYEQGRKVGIISSVPLNHATPAAYYSSVTSRGLTNNIGTQMAESGYHFFGGGGILRATHNGSGGDTANNIWNLLEANGYTILNNKEDILALATQPLDKVVAINPVLAGTAMPYAIDQPEENLSLAELTEVAIASLYGNGRHRQGFFLMVEGGKIDWSCHANDAMATIGDMLDFDAAVGKALEFLRQHPNDTLVVVTGDHETGGMTVGHATTAYTAYYDRLLGQTHSFEYIQANDWAAHKAAYQAGYDWTQPDNLASNQDMLDLLRKAFGLHWNQLNAFQRQKLEDAYDMSMVRQNSNSSAENQFLYGGYEPIIVTLTHILNERASIGWTSYAHTGVPVPVFAEGRGADYFNGFYDNTDIAKRLAQIMRLPELPVYRD
ncbi:MAG: alkaline phosphatase [Chromatiaceae bacterium]|nr:MAG: alkaline phosphatase [Chromatiaceae bacterium]